MSATEIIRKKRDGVALTSDEIAFIVRGCLDGRVSEAQLGAFLMAVSWRGMTAAETSALALEMAHSGDMIDLSAIPGAVDKHSTGGVGDKTTIIVAPLVAAAGVPVAKLSGRSLGHTGGTIDRLEAIPGLRTDLSIEQLIAQVQRIGVAVGAQTRELAPADKKLYATRDSTATVDVVPLIAASVMSKKLAGGAQSILLDVKCGNGAFVQDLARATLLSETMVAIGRHAGRNVRALITAMDEPLGCAVGEGLETREAIETLTGSGPDDLVQLCLLVASHMVHMGGRAESPEAARPVLEGLLRSGAGLEKLREMVVAQGGDAAALDAPDTLGRAASSVDVRARAAGYVQRIDCHVIGQTARALVSAHNGGIMLRRKVGDAVAAGEVLAVASSDNPDALAAAAPAVSAAFLVGPERPRSASLLLCQPIG